MTIAFSSVIASRPRSIGDIFSVRSLDLREMESLASPIIVLDNFRVSGQPFGPHPHAGFSAVTYVFEDSPGSLRSRDSLGNDIVVGPGGIVWTQAGSGVMHEELPAEADRELHGLQVFVNLSAKNKLAKPQVLMLNSVDVPEWESDAGERVKVVVGTFDGVSSSLAPIEAFSLLDIHLQREVTFSLENGNNAIVYVITGSVRAHADGGECRLDTERAVALRGEGRVTLRASESAHVVVLSGTDIQEPVVSHGAFIMNDRSQIEAAVKRYNAGDMGHLAPLSER